MGGTSACPCLHKPQCFPNSFSCFQFPCCCILVPPCKLLAVWPIPRCLMELEMVVLCVRALVDCLKYYVGWVIGLEGSYLHLVIPSVCLTWVWICKLVYHVWWCGTTGTRMMSFAVFGNVPLCTTTVAGSINVTFPSTVVVSIVIVSVGSVLICVCTLILVFPMVCELASVWNWYC